jgi:hypothetical protein
MSDADHMNWFKDRWEYVNGTFGRPNLLTLSNNPGRYYVDGAEQLWLPDGVEGTDFILISDHNRSGAPFTTERIGTNKRMINGRMRSYHIADKLSTSLSWDDLPSRAYSDLNGYEAHKASPNTVAKFTVDGGAGGVEMLKWYQQHHGSFWAFFSFDAVPVPLPNNIVFNGYARVYEMMITDFDYETTKRSRGFACGNGDMYYLDLWNVSMTLEEV